MMSLPMLPLAKSAMSSWMRANPLALAQLPMLMFLLGCGWLTWILLKRSNRYFGRGRRLQSSSPIETLPRPTDPWSGVQRDALARIDREQVEMQERARDLSGQLNSKIIVLEQLIATSAQQIERMEMLLAQSVQQNNGEEQVKPLPDPLVPEDAKQ